MTIGTLVHITPAKKLMIKISESAYDNLYSRLYDECKKKNYPTQRLAVYSRENDDGEEEHFAMVTPDKYDKQNMPKFERLLRKDINFSSRMKSYDFIPDGEDEQRCGINLELISIRQVKQEGMKLVQSLDTFVAKHGDKAKEVAKEAWDEYYNKEAIAARADGVENKVLSPPVLECQTGVIRRRRTPITPVEEQMKELEEQEQAAE